MRIIEDWKAKFPETCRFLAADLPSLEQNEPAIWTAFVQVSGLPAAEAKQAVTDGGGAPLVWFLPLNLRTGGCFNPSVPGRISLSLDIAIKFEAKVGDPNAQQFMRLVTLHEMCHWAWHKQNKPDPDIAGETFESAANAHPDFSWITAAVPSVPSIPAAPAVGAGSTAVSTRIKSLKEALTAGGVLAPAPDLFDGTDVALGMPRGIRNNNPGNIRVGENWLGLTERSRMTEFQKLESDFCVFSEPEWGLRAMARILRNYQSRHGLKTPHDIIARWAPISDNNDVTSYAGAVAKALGIASTDNLDLNDEKTLITTIKAMGRHENGVALPYADIQYEAALQLT